MKLPIIVVLIFLPIFSAAQDRLTRIDRESETWRKKNPCVTFFDKEKERLLVPQGASFGVECISSFSPEWSLTYDSVAHVLTYRKAQSSIWHSTYSAMHKRKKMGGKRYKSVQRKHPKNYVAPGIQTHSLVVTPEQIAMLRTIWTSAVESAEERAEDVLDGVKWEFFIGGQRAKSHHEKNALVMFTQALAEAVRTGNAASVDSLLIPNNWPNEAENESRRD